MDLSYSGGGYDVTVNNPLGTTCTFTNCSVLGYVTSSICSGGADDSDAIEGLVLTAGLTSANITPNGLSCADIRMKMNSSVFINGVQRFNGTTFLIGSQNVTLNISRTTCSAYPC